MLIAGALLGLALVMIILWDGFETIVLPRRVPRRWRLAHAYYRATWAAWRAMARRLRNNRRREGFLSVYGPLSLVLLLGVWAGCLVVGFALIQWGLDGEVLAPDGRADFGTLLYMSGSTFFTLGIGDVTPRSTFGRVITVVESGTGYGFLAAAIGYLPVFYQAFSRREVNISLLDSRAGSPPTAAELLRRHGQADAAHALNSLLHEWERWSAELLESHLSYPLLAYFRSQHENESWLAALTAILDSCSLVIVGLHGVPRWQAHLTFAIARHAVVDLSQVFRSPPLEPELDRLPADDLARLRLVLDSAGLPISEDEVADDRLLELRGLYEPYVGALASYFLTTLPAWLPPARASDDWQISGWERRD